MPSSPTTRTLHACLQPPSPALNRLYALPCKTKTHQTNSMSTAHTQVPGEPTHTGTTLVETATAAIQGFGPINQIHQHLCAFHFYSHDMTRQVEAHHYCAHQNEEMRQCLIYDGPEADARLIGLEYVVSENLFLTLLDEEKPLWHSHEYEVKSGVLFMPRVPGVIERRWRTQHLVKVWA
ncbi:oil body-associated protein 1A [Prunus yedoensis var. nudiflora]|uniref:Oil body-associated protein 1A n=1 Tax=Prunus yedoensis var. nudiflora TaxID=2094558 RepID=A0A314YYT3_PRUYE|nr:oil body-associated protein 1A [Prunus yedoensis var. nudiflora]